MLLDKFFAGLDVKPNTLLGYQATRNALAEQFGKSTPIATVTPLAADEWRQAMKDGGLAEATISKRVKLARQICKQAVRWKMLTENPFTDVKAGSQMNKARQFFITLPNAQKVLDACPDAEWRLIFALSRFAGLRCPSEHLGLRWSDVNWETGRIRVTSTKTERHAGRGERFVPIFPELRPYLEDAHHLPAAGAEFVIARYRQANANLRTQLERIIRKAGLTPWPRLFHNLRSTRQTELGETFPAHVVCAWIANTERVAREHYLQLTDPHFEKAINTPPVKMAQPAAQHITAQGGTGQNTNAVSDPNAGVLPVDAELFGAVRGVGIAATGLEPVTRGL